ncbi:hypothetical protein VOLCADRAFT_86296 [Volvox carteri f. nagariensis]|uniref:Phosphoinositide phospholipase C n=1 Tax=Volvox carteri f. nagariensis TaxID=3068 RepID=D8TIE6_VOLCA|nr:uncharacterized protein VOLCADRAFT_86296 [Volvox carteri f. nagariensis]EFJ53227.1 hypothetical protein VOLCADRAFT_86296 [Volvox carteri f. nagariensis]|eukprot:XP_002946232.1 hypothetical protein VOLCADRAFT_86296 [Volvox carteri f. nagariensis]
MTEVYQDMTQPLPHYFISSGHNSYLTGDQLFASAGTATIVKSLQSGCRVIELDVYNGPICKHGGTLTSPVSFKECIEAIGRAAFVASPYPVIITMENHANKENQAEMASILRRTLGDRLFVPDPHDSRREYLSPAQLINKILCRSSIKDSGDYDPDFKELIYIRNTKCSTLGDMIKREQVVSSSFEESAMPQVILLLLLLLLLFPSRRCWCWGGCLGVRCRKVRHPSPIAVHPIGGPHGILRVASALRPALGCLSLDSTPPGNDQLPGPRLSCFGPTYRWNQHPSCCCPSPVGLERCSLSDELGPDDSMKKAERQKEKLCSKGGDWKKRLEPRPQPDKQQQTADGAGDDGLLGEDPEDAVLPGEEGMVAGSLQELYTFTSRHLARVYPAMWRVTSGNYNPMRAWVRGASLAALNWQVWDKALWCNEAKFSDNGRCGYVLKPEWMRAPEGKLPQREPRTLVVRVHSAHKNQGKNCCMFKDDLFVKVWPWGWAWGWGWVRAHPPARSLPGPTPQEPAAAQINIWGMPCDCATRKTHTAHDTGRLEVNKDFHFPVRFPDMAVLCITLKDDDSPVIGGKVRNAVADTLGYFALPLATLKEGDYKLSLKDPTTGEVQDAGKTWVKVRLHWGEGGRGEEPEGREKGRAKAAKPAEAEAGAVAANPAYAGPVT